MIVDVYNTEPTKNGGVLQRKARLNSWISLFWRAEYNDLGSFSLELPYNKEMFALIRPMDILTCDFDDTAMIAVSVEVKNANIVIKGHSAVYILSKRASTSVVDEGADVEESLNTLVADMAEWEAVEHMPQGNQKLDVESPITFSDGSLLEYATTLTKSVDMGFRLSTKLSPQSARKLTFQCYRPKLNENVRFSALLGNVGKETYTESEAEYANYAIVAGEGEGESRIETTVFIGDGDKEPTGKNRREIYIDARSVRREKILDDSGNPTDEYEDDDTYIKRLKAHGLAQLKKMSKIKSSSFEIADDTVKLGDLIKITPEYTDYVDAARVTAISFKSQAGIFKKTINIGTVVPIGKRG